MEDGRASPMKRKLAALQAPAPAPAAADPPSPKAAMEDRISQLPNDVLGDIVSLLPTKEGARTQIIASRWRHLWRSAPLNLDHHWLRYQDDLDVVVSRVLSAHPGPGRRFCAPVYHLHGDRAATADAWLRSPALDNLHELELCSFNSRFKLPYPPKTPQPQPLPAAAFCYSDTLCVATIWNCQLNDNTAQGLQFPKLKKLVLERVSITESSMHNMLAGSPALECLLIQRSSGFRCVRIKSIRLGSIGVNSTAYHSGLQFEELIIEDAPCLERLLKLGSCFGLLISVISAPKLETLGYLSCSCNSTTLAFDSTFIQGLRVNSLATTVCTVKILAVDMLALSLDVVVDLMRCFPCLEKLYIESMGPGKINLWRRKHRDLTRSFDIRLKTIVW